LKKLERVESQVTGKKKKKKQQTVPSVFRKDEWDYQLVREEEGDIIDNNIDT